MGETMETDNNHDAAFWLPTHFLTDDDFLVADDDDRKLKKEPKNFDLFSNGFDPFGAPPYSLDSPVSSTETERDNENENDDDELLAELTRQLAQSTLQDTHHKSNPTHNLNEKPWLFSTSPQSTLTGFGPWSNRSGFSSNGSPNGPSQVPSPPLTPPGAKNDAAWELLYEAAGQVARLKMNAIAARMNQNQHHHHHHQQNRGLLAAPRNPSLSTKSHPINSFYDFPPANQFQQQVKRQGSPMWAQQGRNQEREDWYCQHHHHQRRSCGGRPGGPGGALGLPQSAWPPLRTGQGHPQPPRHHHPNHRQQSMGPAGSGMRAMFIGGPGSGQPNGPAVKRQSTGTGVFLPRRCGTQTQPEPRKKPTGCSTVILPARVVHALNLDMEEMNNGANLNSQSRFGSGFVTDHDIAMARRNALLSQQQRSLRPEGVAAAAAAAATMVGHDIRLPSDWTY